MNAMKTALGAAVVLGSGLVLSNVLLWTRLARLESAHPSATAPEGSGAAVTSKVATTASAVAGEPEEPPELAPYMGELQRLTHKLHLSLAAENVPLAEFYLYESRELVREMKSTVPEYRGHAIAILAERTLEPAYAAVERALRETAPGAELRTGSRAVVAACNACHRITSHAFVQIAELENNPYAQHFEPEEKHGARPIAHQNAKEQDLGQSP